MRESDPIRKNSLISTEKLMQCARKSSQRSPVRSDLREHPDQLYGAILSYEGKTSRLPDCIVDALKRELSDVTKEFDQFLAKDQPALNESLKGRGQQPILAPSFSSSPRYAQKISSVCKEVDKAKLAVALHIVARLCWSEERKRTVCVSYGASRAGVASASFRVS